ncbi:MAG TPA: ATP-binding protein [Thermoplasmatales archaeon]|nr:ATP-binding protein [Thermoplasmatales archaeon]
MGDIFIDRVVETKFLESLVDKNFFLVLLGRRRIGKTTLLLKTFSDAFYIFIWPNKSINWIIEKTCMEYGIPVFKTFGDLLKYLLDTGRIVIIDEFQNILNVDKSIFGEIQKIVDTRNVKGEPLKLVASGSSHSMINKVFNNYASPLYGRRTHELRLKHLPIKDLYKWTNMDMKNFIKIWSVFEGVPYYYGFIDSKKTAEKNIVDILLAENAILQDEGNSVLSVEFGREAKTYHTLLMAIAEGKTKLNEIASLFDNKSSTAIKYLDRLRRNFNLVVRMTPLLEKPSKYRGGIYQINDNFLRFWFRFIERNRDLIEQGRYREIIMVFKRDFESYIGSIFEKFILELLEENNLLDTNYILGKQWGRIPGTKEVYEIDILGINNDEKKILFVECKWQDNVNAEKIAEELLEKSKYVQWYNNERKECLVVFAKTFKKRVNEYKNRKVYCFSLKDIEKYLIT